MTVRSDNVIELDDIVEREYVVMQRITDEHYHVEEYDIETDFEHIELDAYGVPRDEH